MDAVSRLRGTNIDLVYVNGRYDMDYIADRAIASINEDKLGRGCFAKQLGRTIYEYRGEDSLVIRLYGKWGIGKTPIINLALQEMRLLSEGNKNSPIVVNFNPCFYSSE